MPTTIDYPRLTPRSLLLDRPVRVLHVVPALAGGGMERALLRLVGRSRLLDRGILGNSGVIHGICVLDDIPSDLAGYCPSEVPIWALEANRGRGRYRRWRLLRAVVKGFRPDVVHACGAQAWSEAAAALVRFKDVRLLLSLRGHADGDSRGWGCCLMDRWTTRRAGSVLTTSREIAEALRKDLAIPTDKLVTIPHGVDTTLFCPPDADDDLLGIRRSLRLPPSADVAICVAGLLPTKNIDMLVRAWRPVVMADPLARLLLVGEGPLRGELESLIEQARCSRFIQLLGFREDIPSLLQAADVFVLPSVSESCSNATLEAMASGLPIIGCDAGGMRELVTTHRTGWLVSPGDHEALTHTLLATLLDRNVRLRVGSAARDVAVKHYGIDTWLARHIALYRRLACLRPSQLVSREEADACAE